VASDLRWHSRVGSQHTPTREHNFLHHRSFNEDRTTRTGNLFAEGGGKRTRGAVAAPLRRRILLGR